MLKIRVSCVRNFVTTQVDRLKAVRLLGKSGEQRINNQVLTIDY